MMGGPDFIQQLTHEVAAKVVQFAQEMRHHKEVSFTLTVEERDGAIMLTGMHSTPTTDPLVIVCIVNELCKAYVAHELQAIAPPTLADV